MPYNNYAGIAGLWQTPYISECSGYVDEFNLLTYYYDLYLTRFKYNNVPESIKRVMLDLSNIDRWLWYAPAVCFFKDDVLGLQVLPVTSEAKFNVAFMPESWSVWGANGYVRRGLNWDNSVLLFNDNSRVAPIYYVYKYVRKIIELEKTADVNIDFQKNPYVMEIDEEQKKSADKLFSERSMFKKLILTRKKAKGGIIEGLKANQLKVPLEADKYLSVADKYENKILTYLGFNSVQIEKAERLITSEADSNNEKTRAQYTSAFDNRKQTFDRVNELFGESLTVEPNRLYNPKTEQQTEKTEVIENGNIVNG